MSLLGDFSETYGDDRGGAARQWRKRHERKNRLRNRKSNKGTCRPGERLGRQRFMPSSVHPALIEMRSARIALGISLAKLEKKLGVGAGSIGRWERGEMTPSMLKFFDWCESLGLSVCVGQTRERS